ncbi:hypothetical protein [Sphingosinicella sp. BN140058]|uniref:hypothetical protein n=1 Tax=Sphingosinicella sp. BN140058 TaxID=1892855 RepID=UPI0010135AF5|nr:hypothetical protein [Sphingosinicella sp. BN140058]QAY78909.1 hypothetical protein ETR14_21995 [Sphingosinicella sp. BN140058]
MRPLWQIERAVLDTLGCAHSSLTEPLRLQSASARVTRFENTGTGFFSSINVTGDAPPLPDGSPLDDAYAMVDGLEHGMGFIALFEGRRLSVIEGYALGDAETYDIDFAETKFDVKPWKVARSTFQKHPSKWVTCAADYRLNETVGFDPGMTIQFAEGRWRDGIGKGVSVTDIAFDTIEPLLIATCSGWTPWHRHGPYELSAGACAALVQALRLEGDRLREIEAAAKAELCHGLAEWLAPRCEARQPLSILGY